MEITEVKVFPVNEEKLKAFVSIVFDRCFMVNDIKIIQGRDGLFISMPSRKKKNGEFKDIAHPLNNDTRRRIELEVVDEYERVLAQRGESLPAPARAHNLGDPKPSDEAASANGGLGGEGEAAQDKAPEEKPGAASETVAAASTEQRSPGETRADQDRDEATGSPGRADAGVAGREAAAGNGDGSEPADEGDDGTKDDSSLEEVQEKHLRDSFWSVS